MSVKKQDRTKKYGVEPNLSSRGTGSPVTNKWAHANELTMTWASHLLPRDSWKLPVSGYETL